MHNIDYVIDHFYKDAPGTLGSRWTIDSEIVQVVHEDKFKTGWGSYLNIQTDLHTVASI
jgi:hypothetical protein